MKQKDFDDPRRLVNFLTEKRAEFDLHRDDLRLRVKFEPRGIERVILPPNPQDTPEAVTTAPPE